MKYRVKFSKNGPIKYIGHLDVMRYFQKAIRRAHLPVAYSEGYSPHQIISFAFPLSVGYTSEGEYFDVEMTEQVNGEEILIKLNDQMAEGIAVLDVKQLSDDVENCMSSVFAAKYRVDFNDKICLKEDYTSLFVDYFSQLTIPVNKPKKKGGGFIEIDLKEFLYDYSINDRSIIFTVNASSANNIKPSFVADCYLNYMNVEIPEFSYNIHRIDLYKNVGDDTNINLISLMDI